MEKGKFECEYQMECEIWQNYQQFCEGLQRNDKRLCELYRLYQQIDEFHVRVMRGLEYLIKRHEQDIH